MAIRQNDNLTKWQFDKNYKLTKWQFDNMAI